MVHTTVHAARRIVFRMGTGTDPGIIAERAWKKKLRWPPYWHFPRYPGNRYYMYGDCIFVFRVHDDVAHCITIFGPWKPNNTWWKNGAWQRTD